MLHVICNDIVFSKARFCLPWGRGVSGQETSNASFMSGMVRNLSLSLALSLHTHIHVYVYVHVYMCVYVYAYVYVDVYV